MFRFVGVAEDIKSLLVNGMEKRKVMLCSGNSELDEVEIRRGIFQGDSLSSLVFALALIPLSLILFLKSIEDCAELAIRSLEVYVHGNEERLKGC